ncbi:HAMP domain-containing sensor histidine kinase [Mucilaginibacter arboris]|uniref:histidine kinase n=1 Tax=Mucilaginibacter arboris TaxID=2682090 RepID=A0A7K1SX23_9SPHI|nr:ATP-binding protein [Mucilaginibacter arboris]MVN21885.1 HAMP domain-containing protein [Mucilaginibacter arboris]
MKIKTKLRLGFTFLFVIFLFLGGIAVWFIRELSQASSQILKDNYKTLQYMQVMIKDLGDEAKPLSANTQKIFEQTLQQQEHNITEPGEGVATKQLRKEFDRMQAGEESGQIILGHKRSIRSAIFAIMELNNKAIIKKNDIARKTAHDATLFVALMATFSFLIVFSFIINFPGYVANPIRELSAGIQEISNKNYQRRIHIDSNDEFGDLAEAYNRMAAKLEEYENSNLAKIQFEKLRIETIVQNLNDAVIGFDESGRVLFANPTALRLMNLTENEVTGKYAPDIALQNDLFKQLLQENKQTTAIKIFDDGKESYFSREMYRITVPANNSNTEEKAVVKTVKDIGSVILLKNITRFHELDEAKTNFMATISHELKTPIAAIKMSLKLLADKRVGDLNEEQDYLMRNMQEDSDRLLKITSELLELTQVETGKIQLKFQQTSPQAIIDYAFNTVRFLALQKNIRIDMQVDDGLPKVNADVEKTAWVLVNFLSNAIRYSAEHSSIELKATVKQKMVEISVRDFGKGIEDKYLERIFDRYFQVPTDLKEKGGTGLGLAISKDFIEAQNGKIWVESAIGEGSKFYCALPFIHDI